MLQIVCKVEKYVYLYITIAMTLLKKLSKMNTTTKTIQERLVAETKQLLKDGLNKLPQNWQLTFKRMYSHKNLELPINEVVDNMPDDKLDWALSQVENSLAKIEKQKGS